MLKTVKQLSEEYNIASQIISRWSRNHKFKSMKIAGVYLIDPDSFLEFVRYFYKPKKNMPYASYPEDYKKLNEGNPVK